MAFDLALTSIAHIPSIIGGRLASTLVARSECEPMDDGEEDRVIAELDRCEGRSGEPKNPATLDCLSQYIEEQDKMTAIETNLRHA